MNLIVYSLIIFFFFLDPSYFPGYCGRIMVNNVEVGKMGLVHPEVLIHFNLNNPASALEINLEKLLPLASL